MKKDKKALPEQELKPKYYRRRLQPKNTKASLLKTLRILKDFKLSVSFALIFAFVSQVLSILVPFLLIKMIERVSEGNGAAVTTTGLIIIAAILLSAVLQFFQGYLFAIISARITKSLRTRITQKINKLPLSYLDTTSYGDIMSRLTNDVDLVGRTLEDSLSSIVTSATMLIGIPIIMFIISWQLTLIALCELPICGLITFLIVKADQKYFVRQQRYLGEMNGFIEEIYSSHNVVKVFNGEEKAFKDFSLINNQIKTTEKKSQFLSSLINPLINFVGSTLYITICLFGAYIALKTNNFIFAASIAGFMTYIKMFNQPLSNIGSISGSLQQTAAAAERVFDFLEEKEQIEDRDNKTIKKVKGKVEFSHVNFGYTPEREIIHDFNFTALPGQKIAIVGPTGAGKTTIVNLLMRFYEVNSGNIKIDGISTKDMKRSYVRSLFGMVLQDTWLFEGTIKENVSYGRQDASMEEIVEACKLANVDYFIRTQPNGYDTVITEDSSISSGQKQLLTIARAMVQNAPMLIFDEATSSVDTRTEVLLQSAMDRLTQGRTSFVIAHRLSTIKNSDQIIVMNDGAIVEIGKHKDLLEKNGFYAQLYYSQFERGEEI